MKVLFSPKIRQIIAACLVMLMVVDMINEYDLLTFAYEAQPGMIYSDDKSNVKTRKEPSDSATRKRTFVYGKPVTVIDEVTDANGDLWYLISYIVKSTGTTESSYVRAENVKLDKDVVAYAFGEVNAPEIAFRDDAGTTNTTVLFYLAQGTEVEMLDDVTLSNGEKWYRVRYNNGTTTYIGWMYSGYITLKTYNVEIDPAYVEELKAKGFPESYTYNLAVLHAMYPEWIFEPVMTGLDWNTVIAKETERPINMVTIGSDDAKKSVDPSEYNWNTNEWVIRDGDSWVAVHPEYLAYVMDPRNFLTTEYIFQFESLSFSQFHNMDGVNAVIGSSFMSKEVVDADGTTLNYANAFMTIGQEVGVSPYHLASRVLQEQGSKGTSSLISGTYSGYEGYYNYFNFGAHGITDAAVIQAGLKYAKNHGWDTRYKALYGGASSIASNYIGRGQDTLYFQKFNVVWHGMLYGHQYMGNVNAAMSEGKKIASAYDDKHQSFVFRIPVYENMPTEAVEFKVSGNRNNYLKDLTVAGLSLTPTFTGATTEYSIIVGEAVSSITVAATPVVAESTITGTGTHSLKVGTNTIKILCESESGDVRTYTITVVREGAAEPEVPDTNVPDTSVPDTNVPDTNVPDTNVPDTNVPDTSVPDTSEPTEPDTPVEPDVPASIASDKYTIGTYLTGVEPGTNAADFLAGFTLTGGAEIKLLTAKGEDNTGIVSTGSVLAVYDEGTLIATHEIVVYGDVSGDGKVNIMDAIRLNRHTIGMNPVKGCYLEAADSSRDGKVNIIDSITINKYTIGLLTINQK